MKLTPNKNNKKPFENRRENPIEKSIPGMNEMVSIRNVITFIAERVRPTDEKLGGVIEKVGKRITYAIDQGQLEKIENEMIPFGKLMDWVN
ncbi:hypothetical protein QN360_19635, partial [Glaciimonas sp. CA11.2]